ncbi:probable lysosomal cobalamin transporter [Oppia nitens]|uniref:probable lysosomal cobalamin transporter n=1 Tax=Oppia nitens TaxID=1686743 RepID=UPI0023DA499A|nr:probable lysosomal cobalamin transporter [Oppia nitens]
MLPSVATLYTILPFLLSFVVILVFCIFYVRRYRNPYESDRCATITSIGALFVSLLTCALIPVDIFIVSYMKTSDGDFKDWASNLTQRMVIENAVLYSYYTLYSLIFFCILIVIPFVYFYYEEKSEEGFTSEGRLCSAIKYTLAFLFVAVTLLLIGAFIPLQEIPSAVDNSTSSNSSEWINELRFIWDDFSRNRGEDALSMVLSILTSFGVLLLIVYTGFGMSSFPIGLIRGTKSARLEMERIQESHLTNQTRINGLRDKQRIGSKLTPRERRQLSKLEENERIITLEEQYLLTYRGSLFYKLRNLVRPLQIGIGFIAASLSLIVWISLLLTNIDKAMNSLGMKMGYALPKRSLPNPIDIILVAFQTVFPLDYILIILMALFFIMATMSGVKNLGIWFFFVRLYKIRINKSTPQALLLLFSTLMLSTLGMNILFYCISPQYVSWGSQHYIQTIANTTNHTISDCNSNTTRENCTMTRVSVLLVRFFYKVWFFGAFYYWSMWALIVISFLSALYVIIRPTKSVTEGLLDDEDLEQSDEDLRA